MIDSVPASPELSVTRGTVLSLLLVFAGPAFAEGQETDDPCAQVYTEWQRHPSGKYYYCRYYFKSTRQSPRKMQFVIWFPEPAYRRFTFYFNPDAEVYWCRALNHFHESYRPGEDRWQVLTKGKSKYVEQIISWPDDYSAPDVPGSNGLAAMKAPPPPPDLLTRNDNGKTLQRVPDGR